eukprot:7003252-Lingulodinium_polyedra.AAC.1
MCAPTCASTCLNPNTPSEASRNTVKALPHANVRSTRALRQRTALALRALARWELLKPSAAAALAALRSALPPPPGLAPHAQR